MLGTVGKEKVTNLTQRLRSTLEIRAALDAGASSLEQFGFWLIEEGTIQFLSLALIPLLICSLTYLVTVLTRM